MANGAVLSHSQKSQSDEGSLRPFGHHHLFFEPDIFAQSSHLRNTQLRQLCDTIRAQVVNEGSYKASIKGMRLRLQKL